MVNGRYRKVFQFSSNGFWKNIGCIVSAPTFGLGWSNLWEKEEAQKISTKKRKRFSIRIKVFLMRFIYPILFIFFCSFFMTILIPFFPAIFVVSLSIEERSSEIID